MVWAHNSLVLNPLCYAIHWLCCMFHFDYLPLQVKILPAMKYIPLSTHDKAFFIK